METRVTNDFESALRYLKRRVSEDGVLRRLKERSAYIKRGEKRRRKIFLAASRRKKAQRRWGK